MTGGSRVNISFLNSFLILFNHSFTNFYSYFLYTICSSKGRCFPIGLCHASLPEKAYLTPVIQSFVIIYTPYTVDPSESFILLSAYESADILWHWYIYKAIRIKQLQVRYVFLCGSIIKATWFLGRPWPYLSVHPSEFYCWQ